MAGQVIIQGQLTGVPQGYTNIGPYIVSPSTSNNYSQTEITFASGPNTIAVPSWASGVIIRPDPTNTVAYFLKGASGDTGVGLGLIQPSLINFSGTPPANIVIAAVFIFTTVTTFIFF